MLGPTDLQTAELQMDKRAPCFRVQRARLDCRARRPIAFDRQLKDSINFDNPNSHVTEYLLPQLMRTILCSIQIL